MALLMHASLSGQHRIQQFLSNVSLFHLLKEIQLVKRFICTITLPFEWVYKPYELFKTRNQVGHAQLVSLNDSLRLLCPPIENPTPTV